MESPELSISIGELIGIPKITLRGNMDCQYDQAISGILVSYRDQGTTSLVLDITGLKFKSADSASAMIMVLRSLGPQICVHVLASGATAGILNKAELEPCIRAYSTTDDIANYLIPSEEYFTSRWMASGIDDIEQPLAA